MKILVTGASGFVGSSVMRRMALDGRYVVASSQRLTPDADWQSALQDIDMVIHTAARAHLSPDEAKDALAEFRRTNVEGTLCLAQQAAAAGVKRFVFLSSIKVNGERTTKNRRFTAGDVPAPEDAYGQSKFEAEQGLQAIARNSTMELVIIRPPMVYGPGMKGNLAALLRLVARGVPLPLGTVYNKLSLVALDNLVDLIACCLAHPAAANQIFLVSDGCDFSTTKWLRHLARSMNKPARLLPCPTALLRGIAWLSGNSMIAKRMCDSLQIDNAKTRELLGWIPIITVDEGVARMAE